MANVDALVRQYEQFVAHPWRSGLSGAERVWFALYGPTDERRVRNRLDAFRLATLKAGHTWHLVDLTDAFAQWMAQHDYRDAYFETPDLLEEPTLDDFARSCAKRVEVVLDAADDNSVVAVTGAASLFGLTRVSRLVETVAERVQGRLLVFFPGEYTDNKYRLLDARDGWNYRATPIMAREGEHA